MIGAPQVKIEDTSLEASDSERSSKSLNLKIESISEK